MVVKTHIMPTGKQSSKLIRKVDKTYHLKPASWTLQEGVEGYQAEMTASRPINFLEEDLYPRTFIWQVTIIHSKGTYGRKPKT